MRLISQNSGFQPVDPRAESPSFHFVDPIPLYVCFSEEGSGITCCPLPRTLAVVLLFVPRALSDGRDCTEDVTGSICFHVQR